MTIEEGTAELAKAAAKLMERIEARIKDREEEGDTNYQFTNFVISASVTFDSEKGTSHTRLFRETPDTQGVDSTYGLLLLSAKDLVD